MAPTSGTSWDGVRSGPRSGGDRERPRLLHLSASTNTEFLVRTTYTKLCRIILPVCAGFRERSHIGSLSRDRYAKHTTRNKNAIARKAIPVPSSALCLYTRVIMPLL